MSFRDIIKNLRGIVHTTAIDVGHRSIKLAQIEHRRGKMSLRKVDYIELPADVMVDNEVKDRDRLVETLKTLQERTFPQGVSSDLIVAGINWWANVLVDRMSLNAEVAGSNDENVISEAQKRPPFDDTDVHIHYTRIGQNPQGGRDYLVVAAKQTALNSWASVFRDAGFAPSIIEGDALAVVNIFVQTATPEELDGVVGIATIGESRTHISFVNNGVYQSTRVLQGCSYFALVSKVSNRSHLTKETVIKILQGEESPADQAGFRKALHGALDDINTSFEQAMRYSGASQVNRLFLTGGGASCKEIGIALQNKLGFSVSPLNPFKSDRISLEIGGMFSKETASQEEINQIVPVIGMAMRVR